MLFSKIEIQKKIEKDGSALQDFLDSFTISNNTLSVQQTSYIHSFILMTAKYGEVMQQAKICSLLILTSANLKLASEKLMPNDIKISQLEQINQCITFFNKKCPDGRKKYEEIRLNQNLTT